MKEGKAKTGLASQQITKWFFDQNTLQKEYIAQGLNFYSWLFKDRIFQVVNKDGVDVTAPKAVFKTEKVAKKTPITLKKQRSRSR